MKLNRVASELAKASGRALCALITPMTWPPMRSGMTKVRGGQEGPVRLARRPVAAGRVGREGPGDDWRVVADDPLREPAPDS